MMTSTSDRLVGNSFRPGYRFQRYWDRSMALAFFFAEAGTGLFVVSLLHAYVPGMIAGLALTATLKPYFHLAHMGVPKKSWRAITRPDRSWISRGAIGIGVLIVFGVLHILDLQVGPDLPAVLRKTVMYVALAAGIVVMCYQGFAMSASESFALWASPLLPISSFLYAATAGVMLVSVFGAEYFSSSQVAFLTSAAQALLVADALAVSGILFFAKRKSKGGAFSVNLLTKGQYAPWFLILVTGVGQAMPLFMLSATGENHPLRIGATLAMLIGFLAFRIMIFRSAVYEPITYDLAGSIGLPIRP